MIRRDNFHNRDIVEIHAGFNVVLVGHAPMLLYRHCTHLNVSFEALRTHLHANRAALQDVRDYVCRHLAVQGNLSDDTLLRRLRAEIDSGRIIAIEYRRRENERSKAVARYFFHISGIRDAHIDSYMDAIDFSKPVHVVSVASGTQLFRLEVPGDTQGGWYVMDRSYSASERGIASFGETEVDRVGGKATIEPTWEDYKGATPSKIHPEKQQKIQTEYGVNHTIDMLESSAKALKDWFSNPVSSAHVSTRGGAVQYFSTNKTDIR
jgi:hypothetical protein